MTRARSLLHAVGVFAAVLIVGFVLTTGVAWAARGLVDSLAGAAVVIGLTALGTIASAGTALALAATTYIARRTEGSHPMGKVSSVTASDGPAPSTRG